MCCGGRTLLAPFWPLPSRLAFCRDEGANIIDIRSGTVALIRPLPSPSPPSVLRPSTPSPNISILESISQRKPSSPSSGLPATHHVVPTASVPAKRSRRPQSQRQNCQRQSVPSPAPTSTPWRSSCTRQRHPTSSLPDARHASVSVASLYPSARTLAGLPISIRPRTVP